MQYEYEEEDEDDDDDDEEGEGYEWEYETESDDEVVDREISRRRRSEEEEAIPLEEQDLPDPFSAAPLTDTTKKKVLSINQPL